MSQKINLHRQPDNLVQQQYPDLFYAIRQSEHGMKALGQYRTYLETRFIRSHFRQSDLVESIGADAATICAGMELISHLLTHERTSGHQRYSLDLSDATRNIHDRVMQVCDLHEMHAIMRDHGHQHTYDIRVHTTNEHLLLNHYRLAEICENPLRMRMEFKKARDALTRGIVYLREELHDAHALQSDEARYCRDDLGPELLNRMEGLRDHLHELDLEYRKFKKVMELPEIDSREIPKPEITAAEREALIDQSPNVVRVPFGRK